MNNETKSKCPHPVSSTTSPMMDPTCLCLQTESTGNLETTCSTEDTNTCVNVSTPISSLSTDYPHILCTSPLDKVTPEMHPSLPLDNTLPTSVELGQVALSYDDTLLTMEADSSETDSKPASANPSARVEVFQGGEQKELDGSPPSSEPQNPSSCMEDSCASRTEVAEGEMEERNDGECQPLGRTTAAEGGAQNDGTLDDLERSGDETYKQSGQESSVESPLTELQNPSSFMEDSCASRTEVAEGEMEERNDGECQPLGITTAAEGGAQNDGTVDDLERSGDETYKQSGQESSVENLRLMDEQQRFLRLQHLLKQSNVYSKFLLQRMEDQTKEKERMLQKRKQARKRRVESENKGRVLAPVSSPMTSQRVTRMSLKSPASPSCPGMPPAKKAKGSSRSTKKRKEADTSADFDMAEFIDGKGKLKQMKFTAKGEDAQPPDLKLAKLEDDFEERYFEGKTIPFNQPKLVTGGIMRSYQLDGMEWLKSLYENGVNGILGDEMGLGKTLQCIALISYLIEQGVKGPFLVAAPLSTIPNWVAEFKRFTPKIPVVLYHGTISEREDIRRTMFAGSRVSKFSSKSKKICSEEEAPNLLPVVVTSYHICMNDQRFLENRKWKFLVVDEGHRIKNLNCKLIKSLKAYDASNRLLLTGTPLQNNLAELWSLLNFLLPSIFNDLNSFQSLFDFDVTAETDIRERIITQEKETHVLATLHQILTPFLLRRLKSDVEFSLPPKKEILVYAPLTHFQEKYYKSLLDNTVFEMMEKERKRSASLSDGGEGVPESVHVEAEGRGARKRKSRFTTLSDDKFDWVMDDVSRLEQILPVKMEEGEKGKKTSAVDIKLTAVFVMLRKCINHPYLLEFPLTENGEFMVDEQLVGCCGKMMLLDKMLLALIKDGHKVLIFSQFTRMLDVLEDYLDLRGLDRARLDGSMSFTKRQEEMAKFRDSPGCMIFLLSTRAGGLGINLTSADTVIIYDSDWNPQCDLQAQDRCHRIGQTKPVMVYRLVTVNTIDQRIVERAASKRRLEKMVIHKGKFKGLSSKYDLSIDDLIVLLHSVDHEKVINNQDAVISDEALAALLDRTMPSEDALAENKSNVDRLSSHGDIFKVIAKRDSCQILMSPDNVCSKSPSEPGTLDTPSDLCTTTEDALAKDSGCEVSSSKFSSTSPEPSSSTSRASSSSCSSTSLLQQPQT